MSGLLKTLKNVRRRSVETILQTVGASESTVDDEFDLLAKKFDAMILDMNECAAAIHKTLLSQKQLFGECKEFATIFDRIYQSNKDDSEWPPASRKIEYFSQAHEFKIVWDSIQDVVRSSTTMVCAEDAINPMKQSVSELAPSIDAEKRERQSMLTDYDSYRRRLKGLEQKRDAAESNGKGGTDKTAEILAEITKYENKVSNAEANYNAQNQKAKRDILAAKELHDELMDSMLITVMVTQAEMFSRAAADLEALLAKLPPSKVNKVRARCIEYLKQGGIQAEVKEVSTISKGLAIATGKAVPSDFRTAAGTSTSSGSSSAVNPFDDESPSPAPAPVVAAAVTGVPKAPAPPSFVPPPPPSAPPMAPPSVPPPPPLPVPGPKKHLVIGLFDHEPDADDELPFIKGDVIEVLDDSDEGWWTGLCKGKEGLFPSNYVAPYNA